MHNDVCTFKLCLKSRRETEKVEKQGDFLACTVQTTLISDKLPELHLRKNIIACAIARATVCATASVGVSATMPADVSAIMSANVSRATNATHLVTHPGTFVQSRQWFQIL